MDDDDDRKPGGDEAYAGTWMLDELRASFAAGTDPVDHAIRSTWPLLGPLAYRYRDPAFDAWARAIDETFRRFIREPGLRQRLRLERLSPDELARIAREEAQPL